jgi:hypothetical protein
MCLRIPHAVLIHYNLLTPPTTVMNTTAPREWGYVTRSERTLILASKAFYNAGQALHTGRDNAIEKMEDLLLHINVVQLDQERQNKDDFTSDYTKRNPTGLISKHCGTILRMLRDPECSTHNSSKAIAQAQDDIVKCFGFGEGVLYM